MPLASLALGARRVAPVRDELPVRRGSAVLAALAE